MEQVYSIYLMPSESERYPLFKCVQGDTNTRKISATILNDDGSPFQNESGITATYQSRKPDGTGTSHSATITASSASFVVSVTLTAQDLAAPGTVKASIILTKSGTILATMPFEFNVVAVPMGSNVQSTSDYQQMQDATAAANTATQTANTAATTAVQTANNAAQQALSIANAAADNANDAADYATEAADTASNYNIDLLAEGYDATAIYVKGDYCIYQGALYRCLTDITTPEAWTASHWVAVELSADVAEAQRDATEGYSDTLTAGDLTSDEYQTDTEPYLFRRTFNGANNHAMDEIVGGTVAWNQLAGEVHSTQTVADVVMTKINSHNASIIGTANTNLNIQISNSVLPLIKDHVYLVPNVSGFTGTSTNHMTLSGISLTGYNGGCFKNTQGYSGAYIRIDFYSGAVFNIQNYEHQLFDLTAMFGSTIADAVYAMEQAESGSGVAWFRRYFSEDYYAYDAGTLKSVEAVAHRMVGKNLLPLPNSETKNGITLRTNSDGSVTLTGTSSSITYFDFFPGNFDSTCFAGYIFNLRDEFSGGSSSGDICFRISTSTRGALQDIYTNRDTVISDNGDGLYFAIRVGNGYSSPSNGITFYPMLRPASTSDIFVPFKQHTYKLSPLTLRGIPKLTDGHLTYDGDTYEPSGKVVRKYGVVDLGTLTWIYGAEQNRFTSTGLSNSIKKVFDPSILVCSALTPDTAPVSTTSATGDKTICGYTNGYIFVRNLAYTDAAAFKTAMSGVYLVYELATPTTETASPYEPTQVVYADGTEEYISNSIVPVGHSTKYPVSIKQALTQIAKAPSANGTYILKCTVSGGVASYSWVSG